MKTLKLIILSIGLFITGLNHAQTTVNVNIGTAPAWGPVGYSTAEYYYLPDVESYYDVRASRFIYFGNGKWVRSRYLPAHHRHYDLYNGYKVVLTDYHGHTPYVHYKTHKVKYHKGYRGGPQKTIGVRKVYKEKHGNAHGKGHGKGKGKGHDKH